MKGAPQGGGAPSRFLSVPALVQVAASWSVLATSSAFAVFREAHPALGCHGAALLMIEDASPVVVLALHARAGPYLSTCHTPQAAEGRFMIPLIRLPLTSFHVVRLPVA